MEATDKGIKLIVEQDEFAESPREWDNLGTMVCWHKQYNLGDKHDFKTPEDFQDWLKEQIPQNHIVLPLYMYDHSGIGISTDNSRYPYNCPWDAGQIGWIYVIEETIKKEYGRLTISIIDKAVETLQKEVDIYNQYLGGDVYCFVVEKISKCGTCKQEIVETIDSCGSFYGHNFKENGMSDYLGEYAYLLDKLK